MWMTLIPLMIQALSAIQPLSSGADQNKVATAGEGLIPVLEKLLAGVAREHRSTYHSPSQWQLQCLILML